MRAHSLQNYLFSSLQRAGLVLDRSFSTSWRDLPRWLFILAATLVPAYAVAFVVYTLVLDRYLSWNALAELVAQCAAPLACVPFSVQIRRDRLNVPFKLFSVLRSGIRKLGPQVIVATVMSAAIIGLHPLVAMLISAEIASSSSAFLRSSWLVLGNLGLAVGVRALNAGLPAIEVFALCTVRWEQVSPVAALWRAVAELFRRDRAGTTITLVAAFAALQLGIQVSHVAFQYFPVELGPSLARLEFYVVNVPLYAFEALTFALYYFALTRLDDERGSWQRNPVVAAGKDAT